MELLQAKIRCVQYIADSGWFKPGRKLTLFHGENPDVLSRLFKALEAVHPLYDVRKKAPFADHPKTWRQDKYIRKVISEKKTAACAIFSSDPEQVRTLALLDDSLFETDRIELGRRLDYSRWTSFVELSESARWSDIHDDMLRLLEIKNHHLAEGPEQNDSFIHACKKSDRIKGKLADQCLAWLYGNEELFREKEESAFRECLYKVNLNERYKLARKTVAEELPPIIRLYPELNLQDRYTFAEIYESGFSFDPVTSLLYRICGRYGLSSSTIESWAILRKRIELLSKQNSLGANSVSLAMDRDGFIPQFDDVGGYDCYSGRIRYIGLVAFLVGLLWNDLPFFLFDQYDRGMDSDEEMRFALLCEELSCHKQVMVGVARLENRFDLKDTAMLHVDSKGVVI